jgi:hypothetical protein
MRRRRSCLEAISALTGRSESDSIQRHKPISVLKGQGFPSGERYGRDQCISWELGVLRNNTFWMIGRIASVLEEEEAAEARPLGK